MCRELREGGMSGIRLYMGDLFVSSRVQVGTVIARYLYALGPVPNVKIAEQRVLLVLTVTTEQQWGSPTQQ